VTDYPFTDRAFELHQIAVPPWLLARADKVTAPETCGPGNVTTCHSAWSLRRVGVYVPRNTLSDSRAISMGLPYIPRGLCLAGAALLATLAVAAVDWNGAQAKTAPESGAHPRVAHGTPKHGKHDPHPPVVHGSDYHPPFAAIVVDDNTGQAIYEVNADAPRHPASVTKVMTLYLMFEQIEAGKFKLDTPLQVSAHAAAQAPVRLGLKPGQTITVDEAIRAIVVHSANDAAALVGEAIGGGDEAEGARLMTLKAKALGMTNTAYVNASGLPADEQITTARDQALLGFAIQNRFPKFYGYFSLPSFNYHGSEMHNHNGLLGKVAGVDGIKTGFTEASGYNLVASVRREDRHIVAVILGGTSNAARDARMRQLIDDHIPRASAQRTAPPIMEAANPDDAPAANPIGSAPPAPAVASITSYQVTNVKSDKKPKIQPLKPHLQGAALVHGTKQLQGAAAKPVAAALNAVHHGTPPASKRASGDVRRQPNTAGSEAIR
jgi:D-alanyl-D-alanine carboxypeptidase